jgi:hypothetical protein
VHDLYDGQRMRPEELAAWLARRGRRGGGPRHPALNRDKAAFLNAMSCASAGTCSASGRYFDRFFNIQVFVINRT